MFKLETGPSAGSTKVWVFWSSIPKSGFWAENGPVSPGPPVSVILRAHNKITATSSSDFPFLSLRRRRHGRRLSRRHRDGHPKCRRHRQAGYEPSIPKDGTTAAEAALVAPSFSFFKNNKQEHPSSSWTPTRTSAGTRTRGRTSARASGTSLLRHLLGGGAHRRGGSILCLSRVPAIGRRNNSTAARTIGRRSTPWATSSVR